MSQTKLLSQYKILTSLIKDRNISHNFSNLVRNNSSNAVKNKTASSVYRTMDIFDRKAKLLQRERTAISEDYSLSEYVKEEVGWRMADRVFDVKRTFKNAVELGASRGYVSRHLLPDSVEKIILIDSCKAHLEKAIVGDGVKYETLVMDEETFDLPENSVDLLVSSLALHWVNDLPGCFDRIMKCLKPDGVFLACIFGGDTLQELRQALQLAELERLGGVKAHISPFSRINDIGGLLTAAGFTLQTVDIDSLTVWYPSLWHVVNDVRMLGEGNAARSRPLMLRREDQFAAQAILEALYAKKVPSQDCTGVPATYQLINMVGWKPDPSQPQPMDRGSAEISLKELHNIGDIVNSNKK